MTRRSSPSTCASTLALAACLVAGEVRALTCCGSIQAQADRLGPDETMALRLSLGATLAHGAFFPDAGYSALGATTTELDGAVRLGVQRRVGHDWQLLGEAGLGAGRRRFGADSSTGGGFGDVSLGARFDPRSLNWLALVATLSLPTGRSVAESRDRFGADVTSPGLLALRLGGVFEHVFEEWFVNASLGVTARAGDAGLGTGPSAAVDAATSIGRSVGSGGVSLSLNASAAPPATRAGLLLSGTSRHRVGLALAAALPLDRAWSVAASLSADPPFDGFGHNEPARAGLVLALRWLAID